MAKVGTLERRSPLPAGQYWVDVFGLNIPKADNWFRAFSNLGVHVDATQHFESPEVFSTRNWYKFTYSPLGGTPIAVWDTSLGFPTVADSSIKSSEDTVQRPELPKDPLDELSDWIERTEHSLGDSLGSAAKVVPYAIIGGALYLGYLVVKDLPSVTRAVRKVKKIGKRTY